MKKIRKKKEGNRKGKKVGKEVRIDVVYIYKIKNTLHSAVGSTKSDFLSKTQFCNLRVMRRSRVLRDVYQGIN